MATLEDILGGITNAAGGFFQAKAAGEATAQQTNLQTLNAQAQQQQASLNAQTTQKVALYIAIAVVGLVAFTTVTRKGR
jgi:lipopolysaccharide export LptBFGC system permease protein LptF